MKQALAAQACSGDVAAGFINGINRASAGTDAGQDPCGGALANIWSHPAEVAGLGGRKLFTGRVSGSGLWGAWKPSLGQSYCLLACRKAAYSCESLFWGSPGQNRPIWPHEIVPRFSPAFTWFLFGEEPKPLFLRTGSDRGAGAVRQSICRKIDAPEAEPNPGSTTLGLGLAMAPRPLPRPLLQWLQNSTVQGLETEALQGPQLCQCHHYQFCTGKPESRGLNKREGN